MSTTGRASRIEQESRYRVRDARGRTVSMIDPATLRMLHRHDRIDRATLDAIMQQVGPGTSRARRWSFWICFALGLAGLVGALARVAALGRTLDTVGRVLWAVNAVCLALGLFGLWQSARAGRRRRVRRAMLDQRRCPHCGYDLRGLPGAARDGATVCPECGCAWRLP